MSPDKNVNITLSEIKTILETNEKAIEIYIEVQEQNEEILDRLEKIEDVQKSHDVEVLKKLEDQNIKITYIHNYVKDTLMNKISDMDKTMFRLLVILGIGGAGTVATAIVSVIKSFIH